MTANTNHKPFNTVPV